MGVDRVKCFTAKFAVSFEGRIKRHLDMIRIDPSRHLDHEAMFI